MRSPTLDTLTVVECEMRQYLTNCIARGSGGGGGNRCVSSSRTRGRHVALPYSIIVSNQMCVHHTTIEYGLGDTGMPAEVSNNFQRSMKCKVHGSKCVITDELLKTP